MTTILTENLKRTGAYIVSEASDMYRSREQVIIDNGADLVAGQVLGKVAAGSAVSAAKSGGNTGNGVMTVDATTPVRPGAINGVYRVRLISAAANGGTFRVENPDGDVIGDVAVGATFDDDIKFVVADGSSDFIVGDGFDITVNLSAEKYMAHDPAATDGRERACAILFEDAKAASVEVRRTVHVRDCIVRGSGLTWKSGISAADKAAAIRHLEQRGIIVRG
jgi:hypothetical protein